jgi:two-component sensor histidine kinase
MVWHFEFGKKEGKRNKSMNQILTFHLASNGKLFLATNGAGLIVFDPKTRRYSVFNRNSKNRYRLKAGILAAIREDKKGRIWIGTETDGLFVTQADHPGVFKWFNSTNGLKDVNVESLEFDSAGNIWTAGKFLNRIRIVEEKNGLPEKLSVQAFASAEFVSPNTYKLDASCFTSDGFLFFGGSEGITYFKPAEIRRGLPLSNAVLTGLKVMEKNWLGDTSISFKKHIVLPYDQNFLRLSFANLGFAGLEASGCRYQLVGLQSGWTEEGHHGEARFTNLSPGLYLFRLQAGNLEGRWNLRETTLWIEILPPWWKTWWFYGFSGLGVAVILVLFVRYRLIAIRKKAEEKARVEIGKLEMELKLLRAQINPHFMFNALNSIEDFIWKKEVELAAEYLARFARLMRLILENSHFNTVPITKELEALSIYMQLENMRSDNAFDYRIVDKTGLDLETAEITPMLIQPFVENAILHGLTPLKQRRGNLTIQIEKVSDSVLRISITDNGVGRKVKDHRRMSFGMKLTRERILLLNQGNEAALQVTDLTDADENPAGTQVIILLPFQSAE